MVPTSIVVVNLFDTAEPRFCTAMAHSGFITHLPAPRWRIGRVRYTSSRSSLKMPAAVSDTIGV